MTSLIGTGPNQVSLNQQLGKLAFQDSVNDVIQSPYQDTNISNVLPTLNLDFAKTKLLDPRVTFTRASTGTYYDGRTSAIAEQNLFTWSNTFTNAAWTATSGTVAAGVTDPAGGTTAFSFTATNSNATLYQTLTTTATAYTISVWIQRVSGTGNIQLTLDGTNFTTVTVTGSWVQYSATATPTAASHTIGIRVATNADAINIFAAQLENRSAATAANITTSQPLTNYIPVLQTAASGVPRFDHNPNTGESLGFLIEESRVNLLTYSSAFDNAAWSKANGVSVTTAADIAPDGTQTMQRLVESATNASHYIQYASVVTISNSTAYTFSFFAKASGRTRLSFIGDVTAGYIGGTAIVDLTTGTLVAKNSATATVTITSAGNGVWRIAISDTSVGTQAAPAIALATETYSTTSAFQTYTGNGYSGILIWGAMLEQGSFSSSFIPTTSAQVTRAADAASMTGTNFSSWFNPGQGSFYVDIYNEAATSVRVFTLSDGTITNQIWMGPDYGLAVYKNSAYQAQLGASPAQGVGKNAFSYAVNNFGYCRNGGATATSTTGQLPTGINVLNIGSTAVNTGYMGGPLKRLTYYPQALSAAELQELTS
jgi:hypothetical protein